MRRTILSTQHAALCVNLSIRHFTRSYCEVEETKGKSFFIGRNRFILVKDLKEWAERNGKKFTYIDKEVRNSPEPENKITNDIDGWSKYGR